MTNGVSLERKMNMISKKTRFNANDKVTKQRVLGYFDELIYCIYMQEHQQTHMHALIFYSGSLACNNNLTFTEKPDSIAVDVFFVCSLDRSDQDRILFDDKRQEECLPSRNLGAPDPAKVGGETAALTAFTKVLLDMSGVPR